MSSEPPDGRYEWLTESPSPRRLGLYLRKARELAGIPTQKAASDQLKELAKANKVKETSQSLLAQYEADAIERPDPAVLRLLAKLYGRDYMELLLFALYDRYDVAKGVPQNLAEARWALWAATLRRFGRIAEVDDQGLEELQLRAKADLVRHPAINVLDMDGMAQWQSSFPDLSEYWVVAPNFLDDTHPSIGRAAAKNIARGVHIVYFVREGDNEAVGRIWQLKRLLANLEENVSDADVEAHLHVVPLEEKNLRWMITDLVVANPSPHAYQRSAGFTTIRAEGIPVFATRLTDSDLKRVVNGLRPQVAEILGDAYPFNNTVRPPANPNQKKRK